MTARPRPAITVLGAGSWGTALAAVLARNGAPTTLWGRDAAAIEQIAATRRNVRYLPDLELPQQLIVSADLVASVRSAQVVLIVTPSHAFGELLEHIVPHFPAGAGLAWATKGFDPPSGRFLHELAAQWLPDAPAAIVTGPSFAREVAQGLPTAVTVHSATPAFAQRVAELLHSTHFRAYTGNDMIGAELGGAMKNVLAVATGVADGMQLGLNARAGLITRGLNEMLRLGAAIGARPETLMGLAGLGDLVLTCTGHRSRNRQVGVELGRGRSLDDILRGQRMVAEGLRTAQAALDLGARLGVELPITEQMQAVIDGVRTPQAALAELMLRPQKSEADVRRA